MNWLTVDTLVEVIKFLQKETTEYVKEKKQNLLRIRKFHFLRIKRNKDIQRMYLIRLFDSL